MLPGGGELDSTGGYELVLNKPPRWGNKAETTTAKAKAKQTARRFQVAMPELAMAA